MFSVAGASLFADFLPMLPEQILLLNVLSDPPAMTVATDRVDQELVQRPLRWTTRTIGRCMVVYGLISSVVVYYAGTSEIVKYVALHRRKSRQG